ncbi:protein TRIGALACTOSYLDIACYLGLYCEROL 4, chloroplastic [Lotus japonicus]|uniref:protein TRIGALACTOSYLDIACYLGLYCEROL 4, chloroplastic n=1 Tax=Lotus japonicus TaxID=34305 RepID=UPI00258BC0B8|nr:protein TRIGALACTOSYLDIACYLGLYCEROL 4, chloroplastic [Lotus japonicus]
MAKLRTAIDSAFWDLNIASPQSLDGWAKAVPGDPIPLDGSVASKALRPQQFSFFKNNSFPLPVIPSFSPTSPKDLGSFALQSLLLRLTSHRWWLGVTGQFRPRKLITDIKNEITNADEFDLSTVKDVAKHFIDKSLFSIGLTSQFAFSSSTSMLFNIEGHGEKERRRKKLMLLHKLPNHDLTLEAAWPQLFVDHKGKYWDVPETLSVDLSSLVSDSGLRYHLGIHKNGGNPQAINATDSKPPLSLLPGLCAKAAFTYQKTKYLWRDGEVVEDLEEETRRVAPYDVRLQEPHAAVSGIIGSSFASWIRNGSAEDSEVSTKSGRSRHNADLFGSVCYTFQHGKFTKDFGDLTRLDARLDISSVSALGKKIMNGFKSSTAADVNEQPSASPRLNLIFQQQVAGPVVFRADSRISLESFTRKHGINFEDFICSLNYSFKFLESGKLVAWYSPKRKEGMVELRFYEF